MSAMQYEEILFDVSDPVAFITLNRPQALKAFTNRMLAEIKHALATAEADEAVVGIIITGAGLGFCPGMDMNALDNLSTGDGGAEDMTHLQADPGDDTLGDNFKVTFSYLQAIRKPVIAAINGACAGLGMAIASLVDLRIVEQQAKFSTAFSQRGLIAEHGMSWTLPRLVGSGNALDLLWSARKFDGAEAHRLGFAERLVDTGTSVDTARDYIENLAANCSPTSLQVIKAQIHRHMNMPLGEAMSETNTWMAQSLVRDDFREGVRSFIEKRPPEFKRVTT